MRKIAAPGFGKRRSAAHRRKSLELELERQRSALLARFESWDTGKTVALVAGAGSVMIGLLAVPKIKRVLAAGLRSRFH